MKTGRINGQARRKLECFRQLPRPELGIGFETCGICCTLMAIHYLIRTQFPTRNEEMKLYRDYGAHATKGTLGAGIALALAHNGLCAKLVHASDQLLENHGDYFPEDVHAALLEEHRAFIARANGRVTVLAGEEISCKILRDELREERLVIVQILLGDQQEALRERAMHWILLYDAEDALFYVCDPLKGKIQMTDEELELRMRTPFGASYIAVGKK